MKMALRRLRRFVREGAEDEFDLDETIKSTADQGGMLDIKMRAERKNKVKVLTMFDIGGSMDSFIRISEELFSAVRTEFKHTWNTITSIISCTSASGGRTAAATTNGRLPGR